METVKSYRVRRRLKFGDSYREWGELAPEMHLFRRVDTLVHAGNLTYEDMDLAEFKAGVAEYCPELKDQLYALLHIPADAPKKPAKKTAAKVEKLKD